MLRHKLITILLIITISSLSFRFSYGFEGSNVGAMHHHVEMHDTQSMSHCDQSQSTHCHSDCSSSCGVCSGILLIFPMLNTVLSQEQWHSPIYKTYLPNHFSALFRPPRI